MEAEGCPARRVALSAPSCLGARCRSAGYPTGRRRIFALPELGLCDRGLSPRLRARAQGRKPPELLVSQRLGASEGEVTHSTSAATARAESERKRGRPGQGRGHQAVRPLFLLSSDGSGPKTSGNLARSILGTREKNCLAFKKTRLYWNRTH